MQGQIGTGRIEDYERTIKVLIQTRKENQRLKQRAQQWIDFTNEQLKITRKELKQMKKVAK